MPRPPPRGGGAKKPPGLTPDQWAEQQADKQINAEVSTIEAERQAYMDELDRQAKMELDRGQGFANMLRSYDMPAVMTNIYGNAASDIAGLAGGFSTAMQGIANSQAGEVSNMLSGTGQEGAVRNEGVGMGDVLFGSQGYLPARGMKETGAAYAADAALQPGFAMQLAQQAAAMIRSEGMANMSDFAIRIAEARAQKLGLKQEALDLKRELEDRAIKQQWAERKFAFDKLKEQRDWEYRQYLIANAQGDDERADAYLKRSQATERRMALASQGLDVNGNAKPGFHINKNTGLAEPNKKPNSQSKPPVSNTAPYIRAHVAADADKLYTKVKDPDDFFGGTIKKKMPWQQAFNQLFAKYRGRIPDAQLRAIITQILTSKGFKKGK
jgi:hypothetical protein